jgi:DNA-binding XRE family transcriptional regulator
MSQRTKYPRVSQLTRAQNERLRRAMFAYRKAHCNDSNTELGKRLGRAQPSMSNIMNGKSGASYITASKFAKLVKVPVEDILGPPDAEEGEVLSTEMPDVKVGTFLLQLHQRPGLLETINREPGRWGLATVARALEAAFQSDSRGLPLGGWMATLDAIESGAAAVRPEGSVREDTQKQIGRRPLLPPRKM